MSDQNTTQGELFNEPELNAMAAAGVYHGRRKQKTHPKMRPHIFATRNNIEIIDLHKTKERLDLARKAVRAVAASGGAVMFVGTQPAAREITREVAQGAAQPFVVNRWLGGTLTNFKVISRRIERLRAGRAAVASGELSKYTKKERLKFSRDLARLETILTGIDALDRTPAMLIVANIEEHATAVNEAHRLKIPVAAIVGTSSNPEEVEYPIPANDTGRASIEFIFRALSEAVSEGVRERSVPPAGGPPAAPRAPKTAHVS